jgi:hypothetical protein
LPSVTSHQRTKIAGNISIQYIKPPKLSAIGVDIFEGPGWLNELGSWIHTSLSPIRHGFTPGFVNYKKGALDSQPQVIKFTSCFLMVGGSFWLLPPLKTGRHDIVEILLKVALNTKNQIKSCIYI